jgi:NADH-ubiquinone oxidoreductase chain 2
LAFIPLMTRSNNLNNSEAALNYFLIQSFGSAIILFSVIIYLITINLNFILYIYYINLNFFNSLSLLLISITLILKLGTPPFHAWFPNVIENISWLNRLILITWQKLAPIIILSYIINLSIYYFIYVILSTLTGAIAGLNQTSLRKLIAFSSINHMGWIITAIIFNENLWLIYFLIYRFINFSLLIIFYIFNIFYLSQIYSLFINFYILKFFLLMSLLSLGGLPPFLGFIPKWIIIQSLIYIKINLINLFIIFIRLITLFYYLKIRFAAFMLNYNEFNWHYKNFFKNKNFIFLIVLNLINLFRFFLFINILF